MASHDVTATFLQSANPLQDSRLPVHELNGRT